MDEMLSFYHSILIDRLKSFGYSESTYTLAQVQDDFDFAFPFGFCMARIHMLVRKLIRPVFFPNCDPIPSTVAIWNAI